MKTLIFGFGAVLAGITAKVALIWAVVEFILYLVKDKVFNWLSVWIFAIAIVLVIVLYIFTLIAKESSYSAFGRRNTKKKSKFAQRLEEMQQKQANT